MTILKLDTPSPESDAEIAPTAGSIRSAPTEWLRPFAPLLFAAVCLMIGSLLLWERGFYQDDYFDHNYPVRLDASLSNGARFLSGVMARTLAKLLPDAEFAARALIAIFVGINAFLLGALVQRILKSRLAGMVSLWLFINPVLGYESVLWLAPSSIYVFAATYTLLFLHACYSFLAHSRRNWGWFALAMIAYLAALNQSETMSTVLLTVPFLGVIVVAQGGDRRGTALRCAGLLALPILFSVAYFLIFYANNPFIAAARGSLDINPVSVLDRAYRAYFIPLYYTTLSPEFGSIVWNDVFSLGIRTLTATPQGIVLGLLACAGLGAAVLTWRVEDRPQQRRIVWLLIVTGLWWAITFILLPSVFLTGVGLTMRLLYLPSAGMALALAVLFVLLPARMERFLLLATGILAIVMSILMLGWATVYNARFRLDREQLETFAQNIPLDLVPSGTQIIPFRLDEVSLPGVSDEINKVLMGVFEYPAGALGGMDYTTGRTDLELVTLNYRWLGGTGFTCTTIEHLRASQVCLGDGVAVSQIVDTDQVLLFTIRQGQFFLIENLRLRRGAHFTVNFPLVTTLAEQRVPTLEIFYE